MTVPTYIPPAVYTRIPLSLHPHQHLLSFVFFFFNFFFIIYLFIYGCVGSSFLCEGLLQLRQVGATLHHGARASSLSRPLLLRSAGSRRAGSVVVVHGPSCSAACGIFPDQGSNPCPLHWQADSQPLRHQGSPICLFDNSHSNRCEVISHVVLTCISIISGVE